MGVREQEQRAYQASLRAEEVLHASYGPMRKAKRQVKKATHRAEVSSGGSKGAAFGRAL
jgi:hypothetical protein